MCAPQWGRYFPIYESDKHVTIRLQEGVGPVHPRAPRGVVENAVVTTSCPTRRLFALMQAPRW